MVNKRFFYILAIMLFSVTCYAVGDVYKLEPLPLGKTPFSMSRPADWQKGPISGESVIASFAETKGKLYPNLNVTLEPSKGDGTKGVEMLFDKLKGILPQCETSEAKWIEINGIKAYRSIMSWTSILGKLSALRLFIPWEGKIVAITFVDKADSFNKNLPLFEACTAALK